MFSLFVVNTGPRMYARNEPYSCCDASAVALVLANMCNKTNIEIALLLASVLRILGGLGAEVGAGDGSCVLASFSCQLGIVKSAGIAQSARSIWASTPFGCFGSVTAVTSAWGCSALKVGSVVVLRDFDKNKCLHLCVSWPRPRQSHQLLTLHPGQNHA